MNFYISSYNNMIYLLNISNEGKFTLLNRCSTPGTPSYIRKFNNKLFVALKSINCGYGGFISYDIVNSSLRYNKYYKSKNSFTHLYVNNNFILGGSYHQGCIEVYDIFSDKVLAKKYENSKIHNVGLWGEDSYYSVDLENKRINIHEIQKNKIIDCYEIKLKYHPRHILNMFGGKFTYVLNEKPSILSVYELKSNMMECIQEISTLPHECICFNQPAAIRSDKLKKFIAVSNRGHNSISIFKRDELTGKVSLVNNFNSGGNIPRDFNIIDKYKLIVVLNQESNKISSFKFNEDMNKVKYVSEFSIPRPVCMEV